MPNARVDLHRSHKDRLPAISDAILRGMVEGFGMPADDLFQMFRLHDDGELVFSATYPDADRDDIVFIEVVATRGYTDAEKLSGMTAITFHLEQSAGIKPDNILIVISEVEPANWHAPSSRLAG